MKLATLKSGGRDGQLVVVDRQLTRFAAVPDIAPTLQGALDNWAEVAPKLKVVSKELNRNERKSSTLIFDRLAAPLPRAFEWLDGSVYLTHVERVRKARGAEVPKSFLTDPLMYQGGSGVLLGSRDPILAENEEWGIDCESEVVVVTNDVPMGISSKGAAKHIKLIMLINDVSLRNLIPAELVKGFGFIHGKPASAFSPVAVTPDELGDAWDGTKINLPLITHQNGELLGDPHTGTDMQFTFPELIAHAAKTRTLCAGTIIGSGTVSNKDLSRGFSCLVEKRVVEILEHGEARTPFMRFGDTVKIDMFDKNGVSIFGAIEQVVMPYQP